MNAVAELRTDDPTRGAVRNKWPSWLRFPPFAFCCATTLLVCGAFLGWILVDAQYATTAMVMRYSVGLQQFDPDPMAVALGLWDMMWDGVRSWDCLGPRLLFFSALAVASVFSTSLMLLQFLRQATIRRMLLVVLVICAWLSLWVSYDQLDDWAVLRRAKRALPRFELAAISLSHAWPTEKGTLPEAGAFFAYPEKQPDRLLLPGRKGYPFHEDFGHYIDRLEKGAIRFHLNGAAHWQIEFHPKSSQPNFNSTNLAGNPWTLAESSQLKQHWYLVRYDISAREAANDK